MAVPAIFITGTGTGVGKTVIGCALAAHWAAAGREPQVFKPAESGCQRGDDGYHPLDARALQIAAGDDRPLAEICPHRFGLSMAPAHAAEIEGGAPKLESIVDTIFRLRARPGPLLVEGAGGLLVPLAPGALMSDVVTRSDLALLVVAPLGLGTLNDTQLTVRAARTEKISVAGIILNDLTGEDTRAARRNPSAIQELCGAPLLGVFPYLEGIGEALLEGAAPGSETAARLLEAGGKVDFGALG